VCEERAEARRKIIHTHTARFNLPPLITRTSTSSTNPKKSMKQIDSKLEL